MCLFPCCVRMVRFLKLVPWRKMLRTMFLECNWIDYGITMFSECSRCCQKWSCIKCSRHRTAMTCMTQERPSKIIKTHVENDSFVELEPKILGALPPAEVAAVRSTLLRGQLYFTFAKRHHKSLTKIQIIFHDDIMSRWPHGHSGDI